MKTVFASLSKYFAANKKRTIKEEYNLIKNSKSSLNKAQREYITNLIENYV